MQKSGHPFKRGARLRPWAKLRVRSPPSLLGSKGAVPTAGIGETFAAHPITGTGSSAIRIAASAGRCPVGDHLDRIDGIGCRITERTAIPPMFSDHGIDLA